MKYIIYVVLIGLVIAGNTLNQLSVYASGGVDLQNEIDLELELAQAEMELNAVETVKTDTQACTPFSPGKNNENFIKAKMKELGVTDARQQAYILATGRHESAQFRTLTEYSSGSQYEGRRDLGNTQSGDGIKYAGKGFVQLTGRTNYTNWSKWLNQDFVNNPDLVNKCTETSAHILVSGMKYGSFTGTNNGTLDTYINKDKTDFVNARKLVNGLDVASKIAGYAEEYLQELEPKKVEVKVETPEVEEPKVDVLKQIEALELELELEKKQEVKQEEAKTEEVKQEESMVEEVKVETPKVEEVKQEEAKTEEVKTRSYKEAFPAIDTNHFDDERTKANYQPLFDGHSGADFVFTSEHKEVQSYTEGTIIFAGVCTDTMYKAGSAYGHCVVVIDDEGGEWLYAHLKEGTINVTKGDSIKPFHKLGIMGNSGRSNGAHLHLAYRDIKDDFNNRFDGFSDPVKKLETLKY